MIHCKHKSKGVNTLKLISCSRCGSLVKPEQTSTIDHKRVCHKCKAKEAKQQEALFLGKK
jgi:DNA-directed RNA polymerase subunit M/transcription elongation factor TFIIS